MNRRIVSVSLFALCVVPAPALAQNAVDQQAANASCTASIAATSADDLAFREPAALRREGMAREKIDLEAIAARTADEEARLARVTAELGFLDATLASARAYLAAHRDYEALVEKCRAAEKELEQLAALAQVSGGMERRTEYRALQARLSTDLAELRGTVAKQGAAVISARDKLALQRTLIVENVFPAIRPSGPTRAAANSSDCQFGPGGFSSIDPEKCRERGILLASALAGLEQPATQTNVSLVDRPVDRTGITASIVGSRSGTVLSLVYADTRKFRSYSTGLDPLKADGTRAGTGQRASFLGYSLGFVSDGGDLLQFDERPKEQQETEIETLDRLGASAKVTTSLSWNFYPRESYADFDKRRDTIYKAARVACRAEQGTNPVPYLCENNNELQAWIEERDPKTKDYKRKAQVEALANLYYGPPEGEKLPRFGFGLSGEVAFPEFQTIAALPTDPKADLSKLIVPDQRMSWLVSPYAYYRARESVSWVDGTMVLTSSFKRDYETTKANVCPPATTSTFFDLSGCTPLVIGEPRQYSSWIPGVELRFVFPGPFFIKNLAIAPKLTREFRDGRRDRREVSVPFYFAVDAAGALTSGLSFTYRWDGTKANGTELLDEARVAIVLSTTFGLVPK